MKAYRLFVDVDTVGNQTSSSLLTHLSDEDWQKWVCLTGNHRSGVRKTLRYACSRLTLLESDLYSVQLPGNIVWVESIHGVPPLFINTLVVFIWTISDFVGILPWPIGILAVRTRIVSSDLWYPLHRRIFSSLSLKIYARWLVYSPILVWSQWRISVSRISRW